VEATRRGHRAEQVARQRLEKLNQLDAAKSANVRVDAEATKSTIVRALKSAPSDALEALEHLRLQLKSLAGTNSPATCTS
jgi:hypothetical protein